MRKITVTEFMTLDGVIENPMWSLAYWSDEIAQFKAEETTPNDALLLGRVTYDGFAAVWPERTDAESGGVYFNGARKYVVSESLERADWNNSQIIRGGIDGVRQLKQGDGENLVVHGSGKLAASLMREGLVDVVRLLIYPVVLGKGQRLFEDGLEATLTLVETRPFASGAVGLIYAPAAK